MSMPNDVAAFLNAIRDAKQRNDPHFGRLAIQNFINGSIIAVHGQYDAVPALTWVLFDAVVPAPHLQQKQQPQTQTPPTPQQPEPQPAKAPEPAAAAAQQAPAQQQKNPARMDYREFLFFAKATPVGVDKWLKDTGRSKNNPFTTKDIEDYARYRKEKRVQIGKMVGSKVAERHGKSRPVPVPHEEETALLATYDVPEDDVPGMLGPHWDYKQFKLQVLWQQGKHYDIKPESRMIRGKAHYRREDILAFKELINAKPTSANVVPVTEERIRDAENTILQVKRQIK